LFDFGKCHDYWITCIAISGDDRVLFSGSRNGDLKKWDMWKGNTLVKFWGKAHDSDINAVQVARDGKWAYTGGGDGKLKRWAAVVGEGDVEGGREAQDYGNIHKSKINDVAVGRGGEFLFTVSADMCLTQFYIKGQSQEVIAKERLLKRATSNLSESSQNGGITRTGSRTKFN
jgi:WD40 repeat protein